ncbi:murein L,D-transpeptidase catalytic domain family protein [bacterium]|nr:murein L,D-transpeptidase catalytic domain family protein [bacterium]
MSNPKYLTVVDFTKPNTQNRFYVINMNNNTVEYATTV